MWSRDRQTRPPMSFGFGAGGPPPTDLLVLIGVLFVTYSLLRLGVDGLFHLFLTPEVFTAGHLWQLVTYAFVGLPTTGGLWFLFSLLMIFWFGRDTYRALGRRSFWQLLAWVVPTAAVVATLTQLATSFLGGAFLPVYVLMQGQYILLTIFIAAFATLYGHATIFFMFVLPIRARWFLWIEILFAFMGYLDSRDLPGFVGLSAAVGATYAILVSGGPRRALREGRLRLERKILELRMRRLRAKRGFKVVSRDDDVPRGPWVN